MPRQLRIQYPRAIYHVMNRGDRREPIFRDEAQHDPVGSGVTGVNNWSAVG